MTSDLTFDMKIAVWVGWGEGQKVYVRGRMQYMYVGVGVESLQLDMYSIAITKKHYSRPLLMPAENLPLPCAPP